MSMLRLMVLLAFSQSCFGYLSYKVYNASTTNALCGEFVNSAGIDLTFSLEPGATYRSPIDLDATSGAGPTPATRLSTITRSLQITFYNADTDETMSSVEYDDFFPETSATFIVSEDGVELEIAKGQ